MQAQIIQEEICTTIITTELPPEFNHVVREVVNSIVYVIDDMYSPSVTVCLKGNMLTVDIHNKYIHHIDTCAIACELAVEALNCVKKGYIEACYRKCREVVRRESSKALNNSIEEIKKELELMGLEYTVEIEEKDQPQYAKFTIKL